MSVTTFEWRSAKRDAPTTASLKPVETYRREAEIRPVVDRHVIGDVADQLDEPAVIDCHPGIEGANPRALRWLHACRNLLTAIGEVWLFSSDVCGDWRQPCRGPKSQENSKNRSA